MAWIQIHVATEGSNASHVEALLEDMGALSVTLQDAADQPLLEPAPGETPLWDSACVTGLFEDHSDLPAIRRRLAAVLPPQTKVVVERLDDRPWERAWLEHFRPMQFGERLWVFPEGRDAEDAGESAVVLTLDPGLAFGTGTHATTALCLEWLSGAHLGGKTAIDYGCGSGILAIAALLLGAQRVVAVDHDPQALLATRQNAEKNGVADQLVTLGGDRPPGQVADLVLANILAGTLVELAAPITACVKPGGDLVLSGILAGQAARVEDAYSAEFELAAPLQREDWILIHGKRAAKWSASREPSRR